MDLGVLNRAELLATDLTDADLRRKVRSGELTRLRSGWYAGRDADDDAVIAARRFGAISCVTGLRKHGLWIPPGYDSLHVRAGKAAQGRRRDYCHLPGRPLPVGTILDEIPLCLCCAAGCMTAEDWIAVTDSALNSLDLDIADLHEQMPRTDARIDHLLSRCDSRSQSGTESIVRVRLRALGFRVEVQPKIPDVGHVDLKVGRLLLECDSKLHHTSLENYRKDRRRDRKSLGHKYMAMRLTYDDALYGWDETLADIREVTLPQRHRIRRGTSAND